MNFFDLDDDYKQKSFSSYDEWVGRELELHSEKPGKELLKAEPDLKAVEEPTQSPELEAAIEILHEGGLQKLTALQQKIFQLSVVEGMNTRDVGKQLKVDQSTVVRQLKVIGKTLRKLCLKKLHAS